ncbi:MAG: cupin [Sphingomicrobium sp.]
MPRTLARLSLGPVLAVGIVRKNPRGPLVVYRGAVDLKKRNGFDPGTVVDALFGQNGWGRSWRDTIYDFVHYHSQIHEAMGVARGSALIEFGGVKGRRLRLKAGDVAIVPAGTGHRLIKSSRDFLVAGAYPPKGTNDECTDTRMHAKAKKGIAKTAKPTSDPVYGKRGPLVALWSRRKS